MGNGVLHATYTGKVWLKCKCVGGELVPDGYRYSLTIHYWSLDVFQDPLGLWGLEPGGEPYNLYVTWDEQISGGG